MSWFEFWSSRQQQAEHPIQTAHLNPSQRDELHGNHELRAELQSHSMASLLPPVGVEVFRHLTPASLEESQQQEEAEKKKEKAEKDQKKKPVSLLKAGKPLPFIYRDLPPELLSIPLEDLDPFYQSEKTFVVICKENLIHRFNAEPACYLFSPFNFLRTSAIKILLHPLFSVFFIVTIVTNCLFMAAPDSLSSRILEHVFMSIYICEVLLKLLSRGVCFGKFTFLRDPWNWLDVLNITGSVVSQFTTLRIFTALKTIPRVLKLFSYSPGLKKTAERLVQTLKGLSIAMVLSLFVLSILALISMQFFMGVLRHKCVMFPPLEMMDNLTNGPPRLWTATDSGGFEFQELISNKENYYYREAALDGLLCGNVSDAGVCPGGFICMRAGKNPNYGYTSFDAFGWSLLSMVRIMTQDFWCNLLQLTLRGAGKSYLAVFVLIIFPGCFLVVSLIVAAVVMEMVKQEKAEAAEAKRTEEEFSQIVKVLKKREENQVTEGTEPLEEHDSLQKKKPAARTQNQENVTVEDAENDIQSSCCSCADRILTGECCGCSQWLKQKFRPFVLSPLFDLGITFCIIVQTGFLAMEHYPMTPENEEILAISNLVFFAIFTAELLLRVLALGIKGYFQVSWHILDFTIVTIGLLELGLADVEGLSVLRVVRLLRPLRLGRWWPGLGMLMKTAWLSVGSLSLILLFVVFSFVVVGTQLFKHDYKGSSCNTTSDCELSRWHMGDFLHTNLLVFRVLFGEWIETMWDCMEVSNQGLCIIYHMVVLLVGKLLVLSLFLYLLLRSIFTKNSTASTGQGTNQSQIGHWTLENFRTCAETYHKVKSKNNDRKDCLDLTTVNSDQSSLKHPSNDSMKDSSMTELSRSAGDKFKIQSAEENEEKKQKSDDVQKLQDTKCQPETTPEDCCCAIFYSCCTVQDMDTSQGAGRVWYKFRKACLLIVQHRLFEVFIIFIILLSSAALVLEDTLLHQHPVLQMVLDKADQVFTYLFLLEMLLKWIAFGFKKYFTSFWCWVDFLILDVSLFSSFGVMMGYSIESMRTLRAVRTMRVPSRFKGMRLLLQGMVEIVPSMCSCLLVVLFVWLIFSMLGVNLFAGKFYYCFNETSNEYFHSEVVNNKTECFDLVSENFTEVRWKNTVFNFDNVGMGYLSLLILATCGGWVDIMYSAVDARQVEDQPVNEFNLAMYLYLVLFIIFGCFFTSNFFISALVDALHQLRNKAGGKHVFMTEEQLKFHGTVRKMFTKSPEKAAPRPTNQCQARLFDLVTAPLFEIVVVVLICVNMVVMMTESDDMSDQTLEGLFWALFVIRILYCIEFLLKIVALRRHYFSYPLNILDFVVLILMIIGLFFSDVLEKYFISPHGLAIFRLARISRILPFFRWSRRIQRLLTGFIMSLPALMNIGLLFFLVVYTYSFIGMRTFGLVQHGDMIDDMTNFETFGNSMISMIVASASWDSLLMPVMKTPPDCDPAPPSNCGNPSAGIVFFCSYISLYLLLVVHLFIAVILESFNSRNLEDAYLLQMFYNTWRKFDPEASQVIQHSELSDFCDALQEPLRIPKPNNIQLIPKDQHLLPGDRICCADVFRTVMAQAFGESRETDCLTAELKEKFTSNNPEKVTDEPISSTLQNKQEEEAMQNGANGSPDQPVEETKVVSVFSQ